MEEICIRFDLMAEKILKKIDHQSLAKLKEASKKICKFLDNGRFIWQQMILKNVIGNFPFMVFNQKEVKSF